MYGRLYAWKDYSDFLYITVSINATGFGPSSLVPSGFGSNEGQFLHASPSLFNPSAPSGKISIWKSFLVRFHIMHMVTKLYQYVVLLLFCVCVYDKRISADTPSFCINALLHHLFRPDSLQPTQAAKCYPILDMEYGHASHTLSTSSRHATPPSARIVEAMFQDSSDHVSRIPMEQL